MLYQLQKGDDVLKSSKKTPEERIKELQENGEVFPASNDYIYKAIMTNCFLFKADMTYRITDIPKDLILKTYYEKNTEFVISNALELGKRFDILFGIEGYVINYELNNRYSLAIINRNDNYLDKVKMDISNKNYSYNNMPKAIQINLNNFNHLNKKNIKEVFKSRDENGVVENVKWEKYHISFKKVYKKYKKGIELSKLEKELLILRLRKIDEISKGSVIKLATTATLDIPYKGQRFVISAIKELKKLGYDNYHYYMIGGGNSGKLRQLAERLGIKDQIHFVGKLTHGEVFEFLKQMDIF